jgi:hypothetical protein
LSNGQLGNGNLSRLFFVDKRKKIQIDYLKDKRIDFKNNRTFELKNLQNEVVDVGKWRISDFGFKVAYVDSTGHKSSSDSKKIIAIFSEKDLSILGEASFSKKEIKIDEMDDKFHKFYYLKKKY